MTQQQIIEDMRVNIEACCDLHKAALRYLDREDLLFDEKVVCAWKMITIARDIYHWLFKHIEQELEKLKIQ